MFVILSVIIRQMEEIIGNTNSPALKKCFSCHKLSLFWNKDGAKYVCTNPDCRQVYSKEDLANLELEESRPQETVSPESNAQGQADSPLNLEMDTDIHQHVPAGGNPVSARTYGRRPVKSRSGIAMASPYPQDILIQNKKGHTNLAIIIVSVLAIIAFVVIWETMFNTKSASPTAPVPTVVAETHTPTPTPIVQVVQKPEYLPFNDELVSYTMEYPYDWNAVRGGSGNSVFTNTDGTMINAELQKAEYQNLITLLSANPEIKTEVTNARQNIGRYSKFLTHQGVNLKRIYVYDYNSGVLRIECTYGSTYNAEKDTDPTSAYILHMMDTFHLKRESVNLNANINPFQVQPLSGNPTGSAPAIMPSQVASTTKSTLNTGLNIDAQTGTFADYYLGIVESPDGVLGGNGCYDDAGDFIVLINNKNSVDPTYNQLIQFLQENRTDQYPYEYVIQEVEYYQGNPENLIDLNNITRILNGTIEPKNPQMCGDFAERLHNDAETAGIRCGYVSLEITGYSDPANLGIPSNAGHACNVFRTTDKGLIYVDATGMVACQSHPDRVVSFVNIQVGKPYTPVSVFPQAGWKSESKGMGTVTGMYSTWDGTWNN